MIDLETRTFVLNEIKKAERELSKEIAEARPEPTPIDISVPEIVAVGPTCIELNQSYECGTDYYGGIYVGETADNNDNATLVKNPGTINKTITGLHGGTTYYINGVGLPTYGEIMTGEQAIVVTTPIPDEYQLTEYTESPGTSNALLINTGCPMDQIKYWETDMAIMTIKTAINNNQNYGMGNSSNQTYSLQGIKKVDDLLYYSFQWGGNNTDAHTNTLKDDNFHKFVIDVANTRGYIDDPNDPDKCVTLTMNAATSDEIYLFLQKGREARRFQSRIAESIIVGLDDTIMRHFYPVYRKSDNFAGLYDIITQQFYSNNSGGFIAGPNRDFL